MGLLFSRSAGEEVIIADEVVIKVLRVENGKVRLLINAPADVSIHRREVADRMGWKHPYPETESK